MQSNDLKKILTGNDDDDNDGKVNDEDSDINTSTSTKNKYVLSKNMQFVMDIVDEERKNLYNKQWARLDKSIKYKLITEYINNYIIENKLTDNVSEQLKKLLYNNLKLNKLNKQSDVVYDSIDHKITKINVLIYNEEKNKYEIKSKTNTKAKINNKSKTNIDRLAKGKNSKKNTF